LVDERESGPRIVRLGVDGVGGCVGYTGGGAGGFGVKSRAESGERQKKSVQV
jgi:hypothetical protein